MKKKHIYQRMQIAELIRELGSLSETLRLVEDHVCLISRGWPKQTHLIGKKPEKKKIRKALYEAHCLVQNATLFLEWQLMVWRGELPELPEEEQTETEED